jgi:hypothetical protein
LLSYFVTVGVVYNPVKIFDFNKSIFMTLIINTNIAMESFVFISAFLGTYKVIQIYDKIGFLRMRDIGNLYLGKFLRLAPVFYFVFFFGWIIGPWMNDGPFWNGYRNFFDQCET